MSPTNQEACREASGALDFVCRTVPLLLFLLLLLICLFIFLMCRKQETVVFLHLISVCPSLPLLSDSPPFLSVLVLRPRTISPSVSETINATRWVESVCGGVTSMADFPSPSGLHLLPSVCPSFSALTLFLYPALHRQLSAPFHSDTPPPSSALLSHSE